MAEQWIKPLDKKQNGRADMITLRNHYSGEGNTSRRIAAAENLCDTLHYKNERALPFSTFLDKLQKMFNIFEEENKVITEPAKVRMLIQKVQHPQLQTAVDTLKVHASIDRLTFTVCANHLSAQVSELPDPQVSRKVSAASSNPKRSRKGSGSDGKRIRGGGSNSAESVMAYTCLMAVFGLDFIPIGTNFQTRTVRRLSIQGHQTRPKVDGDGRSLNSPLVETNL